MTDPRVPPSDLEAERALIGSVLLDPGELERIAPTPLPEDFYLGKHAAMWRAILDLHAQGSPPDLLVVWDEVKRRRMDGIVTQEYIAETAAFVGSPVHACEYAKIVREKAKARSILNIAHTMAEGVYASQPADVVHTQAQERLYTLGSTGVSASAKHIGDTVYDVMGAIQGGERKGLVVPTGYVGLDDLLAGGFHGGELSLIAGRASMGKTSFALNCVSNAALAGHGVLVFSLEMTSESVVRNMMAAHAKVSGERMRKGKAYIGDEGMERLAKASHDIGNSKVWISDACRTDVADIRREVRRVHSRENISLVVIDYLQLLEGDASLGREQAVSAISRGLKIMAKDTGLCVVALAQLNRMAEQREGHRPRLADLRESGSLEQDADNVMLVYRPYYYSRLESDKNLAEIIVAKQRHGATETAHLRFDPEFVRFRDPTKED